MLQRSRFLAVVALSTVMFLLVCLGICLFCIQFLHRPDYIKRASPYLSKSVDVQVPRGTIYDARGEVLAADVPCIDIYANTRYIDKPWTKDKNEKYESASLLAPLLDMEDAEILERFARGGYRVIKKKITDPDVMLALYDLKQEGYLRGIEIHKGYKRYYPHGEFLGHTVGFVNHEGRGAFGVEKLYDAMLQGRAGSRVFQKDGVQNELFTPNEKMDRGIPGGDLHLTIDGAIQFFAELELTKIQHTYSPKWAAAVVLEPATGRILAAASVPALDPVNPAKPPQEGCVSHWMNRVFAAEYTPGSTFKPLIMAMAVDQGLVDLNKTIDCEAGKWRYRRRTIRDSHEGRYNELLPTDILVQSSNVGMSKIILRMVPEGTPKGSEAFHPIREKLDLLGFGKRPGIFQKAFEGDGLVHDISLWTTTYSLVSLSFGREIAATPIQMASAFAVLANEGVYVPPKLIDAVYTADGNKVVPPDAPSYRVYDAEASRNVRDMLVQVVERGSGKKARIPGIKVAGKTGTAEKLPARKEVTSSFIAFAPADAPALLALVVVDEPQGAHYASTVAAPHVKAILDRGLSHLNIRNDDQACAETVGGFPR